MTKERRNNRKQHGRRGKLIALAGRLRRYSNQSRDRVDEYYNCVRLELTLTDWLFNEARCWSLMRLYIYLFAGDSILMIVFPYYEGHQMQIFIFVDSLLHIINLHLDLI